jgi:short-subunit dehydrogenase
MSSRTALITGASAGIGESFAKEFARHGLDLVLVARRKEKLESLAEQIHLETGAIVHVCPVDLAEPDSVNQIMQYLQERKITVNALVNNAGYGLDGGFLDSSWEEHRAMHQVMLTSYLELCYQLLPGMVETAWGRIINVSSVAGLAPASRGSMYSAIKKYVIDLTLAIDFEFRDQGIQCCAVCPGFTYTEFHDVMGVREQATTNFPKFMWQSADDVAKEGFEAVMDGKVLKVNGLFNRILVFALGLLPNAVLNKMARNQVPFAD